MTVGTLNLLYLLAARVMSVILLGMRARLVVLALSAISMMQLGLTGYSHFYPQNAHPNSFGMVTNFRLNYTCVGAFLTLTCGKLIKGLFASIDDQRLVAEALLTARPHCTPDQFRGEKHLIANFAQEQK